MAQSSTLAKVLGVKPDEVNPVLFLLLFGFTMGVYLATYDVAAFGMFIGAFDEQEDLPVAFILSGILGIVSTYAFALLQRKISYSVLVFTYTAFMGVVTVFLTLGFPLDGTAFSEQLLPLFDQLGFENYRQGLIYITFIFGLSFSVNMLLIFWGVFGRMFTLRQTKTIIGSVDTGMLVAGIVSLFSIPFLTGVVKLSSSDLLYVASGGIIASVVVTVVIARIYKIDIPKEQRLRAPEDRVRPKGMNLLRMVKSRYILVLVGFVLVSMVAMQFVDYSYSIGLGQLQTEYDWPEETVSNFAGILGGTIVIISFLFQTFVTDRIIDQYGLRVSLLITPFILLIFIVLTTISAFVFGSGTLFIVFVMAIILAQVLSSSLKDALDGPAFKLYYLPIDSAYRFDIQTKIDGFIVVFGTLLAGIILQLIDTAQVFEVKHVVLMIVPLVVGWLLITSVMYVRYRETLVNSLEEGSKHAAKSGGAQDSSLDKLLTNTFEDAGPNGKVRTMQVMEHLEPGLFEKFISRFVTSRSQKLKQYSEAKYKELELEGFKPPNVKNPELEPIRKLALQAAENAESKDAIAVSPKQLYELTRSRQVEDKILAAKVLRGTVSQENIFVLIELLRSIEPEVRKAALVTARRAKRKETWTVLIDMLASPTYGRLASAALIEAGEATLPTLEAAFHKSGQREEILLKILQIYGRIGGKKAIGLLWEKIDYPSRLVVDSVLKALIYNEVQATGTRTLLIRDHLDRELQNTLWNIAALSEIPEVDPEKEPIDWLREALDEEVKENYSRIFLLLSLMYDPRSVDLVRQNIEADTSEGTAYAIELLDLFMDKDLKPTVVPVLDDIPTAEKILKLQDHYPRLDNTASEVLLKLINRDYTSINNWTKCCALYSLAQTQRQKVSNTVVAQLFNDTALLRETAAWLIFNGDKRSYHQLTRRLDEAVKKELDELFIIDQFFRSDEFVRPLKIDIVKELHQHPVFASVPGADLVELVDTIRFQFVRSGKENLIDTNEQNRNFIFLSTGKLQLHKEEGAASYLEQQTFYNLEFDQAEAQGDIKAAASEDSLMYFFPKEEFYTLMGKLPNLARAMIYLADIED